RVPEDDRGAEPAELVGVDRLDRPLRPDGHEHGRRNLAVLGAEDARTSVTVGRDYGERVRNHSSTFSAASRSASASASAPDSARMRPNSPANARTGAALPNRSATRSAWAGEAAGDQTSRSTSQSSASPPWCQKLRHSFALRGLTGSALHPRT